MIGTSHYVYVAGAASKPIVIINDISLQISVKAMDVDVKERKLYWINTEDGVRERGERESVYVCVCVCVCVCVLTCYFFS